MFNTDIKVFVFIYIPNHPLCPSSLTHTVQHVLYTTDNVCYANVQGTAGVFTVHTAVFG